MRHHKYRFAAVATAAFILTGVALSGCATDAGTDEGFGPLEVRLSWQKDIASSGAYFADQKGYYTDGGFSSVELISGGQAAPPVASDVVQGNALYGIDGPDYAAQAIQAGTPLTMIGCQQQETPLALLSAADSGIDSPQDLAGKRIGVQDANLPPIQAIFEVNGIDPDSVTIVPWQGDATILAGGEVDAVLAFGAEYTFALDGIGFDYRRDLVSKFGLHNMTYCYEVLQSSIENSREALKAALIAEIKGWRDALTDPEQAAKYTLDIYGSDLGLNADSQVAILCALAPLMVTDETNANGLFTMSDQKIAQNMESLAQSGFGDIDRDDLFDTTLLGEIYEEHPELKEPIEVGCPA
jgi:ABC-type nitrate/sulfonate/bicarbonate transport system substrate-binding protein